MFGSLILPPALQSHRLLSAGANAAQPVAQAGAGPRGSIAEIGEMQQSAVLRRHGLASCWTSNSHLEELYMATKVNGPGQRTGSDGLKEASGRLGELTLRQPDAQSSGLSNSVGQCRESLPVWRAG